MRCEWVDDVALVRLEGGRANAMNERFLDGVERLFAEVEASPARAVVLTGYERFFSAGLDLPSLLPLARPAMERFISRFGETMIRVFSFPRPVVAAVNGHAIAGGCVLALQADYRLMSAGEHRIGLNEAQLGIGLPPVVVETLRAQMPVASLIAIALEGTLFLPEEAREIGLIDEVVPPQTLEPWALSRARELAAVPAAAWAQIKLALRRPALEAVRSGAEDTARWIDTWFSEPARTRIAEAAARIHHKKS